MNEPIERVEWLDHYTSSQSRWASFQAAIEDTSRPMVLVTVGRVLAETDDALLLAHEWRIDDGESIKELQHILKATIQSRTVL